MLKLEGVQPPFLVENLEEGVERQMELEFSMPELQQLGMYILFGNLELETRSKRSRKSSTCLLVSLYQWPFCPILLHKFRIC